MNPGAIETTGQVAGSAIDALKSTPVVLALVIFNVLYMLGGFYAQIRQGEQHDKAAERWKSVADTAMKYCVQQPHVQLKPSQKWVLQSEESMPVELPPLPRPRPPEAE